MLLHACTFSCSDQLVAKQKFNDEPLYEEIADSKAEDYEAVVPNKPVYVNEKPMVVKKQISYEMSQCPAYRDRYIDHTLKKQN